MCYFLTIFFNWGYYGVFKNFGLGWRGVNLVEENLFKNIGQYIFNSYIWTQLQNNANFEVSFSVYHVASPPWDIDRNNLV